MFQPCYLEGILFVSHNWKQDGYLNSNNMCVCTRVHATFSLLRVWLNRRDTSSLSTLSLIITNITATFWNVFKMFPAVLSLIFSKILFFHKFPLPLVLPTLYINVYDLSLCLLFVPLKMDPVGAKSTRETFDKFILSKTQMTSTKTWTD